MTTTADHVKVPAPTRSTWLTQIRNAIQREPKQKLILRLTLLLLTLHSIQSAPLAAGVRILAILMLVVPSLLRSRVLWGVLGAVLIFNNAERWWAIDNHQFLFVYWTLACGLTLAAPKALATNARLLVVVAFGFAVVWKLVAGQYLNGSFFYATLMTDPRLADVVGAIGTNASVRPDTLVSDMRALLRTGSLGSVLPLPIDSGILRAALALSWLGFVGEAAVAILHSTTTRKFYFARHATLLLFVLVTYWLLPVTGFAFLLAILGLAQVEEWDTKLTPIYLTAICAIQLTLIPWTSLLPQGD